ncbi:hypothetical protein OIB37_19865 [Streptomyces sp. NBC_00820]|uniref:hypothetical protein n=1 Tax=Streptomyces sp. NBC_00820 TaxID=2975842 RepID=UPI002ED13F00|nr:hypothetical protein OIB37_19865 [Streptomyces sp. NBC_00820]
MGAQLPPDVASLLRDALEPLDALFAGLTVDDTGSLLREELGRPHGAATEYGRWWDRRPDPLPW